MTVRSTAARARRRMVRKQLAGRGISDRRVLAVMASIPREHFVREDLHRDAYADTPLGIGWGQTISQPYMVALMTQAASLHRTSIVLDVGTGSGYQAAILARLAAHVWSIERIPELAERARRQLAALHIHNVTVLDGDGALGHREASPYGAIVVAAAAPEPPEALLDQLADNGRLVIPLGNLDLQELSIITRRSGRFRERRAGGCRFVPLVSPAGFPATG